MMFNNFGRFCDGFFSNGRFFTGGSFIMGIGIILILVFVYFMFKKDSFILSKTSESPLDLLKRRYVNGDISEGEYLEKKSILDK